MRKYLILSLMLITACSSNAFLDFYNEELSVSKDLIKCETEHVRIVETSDLKNKVKKYKNKEYSVIGFTIFKGEWQARSLAIDAAKEKNACLVVIESSLSGTEERNYVSAIPHSGYARHSDGTSSKYTYYSYINGKYYVNIYEQKAVFMSKIEKKDKKQ